MARTKKNPVEDTFAKYREGAQKMLEWAATAPLGTEEERTYAQLMVQRIKSGKVMFEAHKAALLKPLEDALNARIAEAAPVDECFISAIETIARRLAPRPEYDYVVDVAELDQAFVKVVNGAAEIDHDAIKAEIKAKGQLFNRPGIKLVCK